MDILTQNVSDFISFTVSTLSSDQKQDFGERMIDIKEAANEMILRLIPVIMKHVDDCITQTVKTDKNWLIVRRDSRALETVFGTLRFERLYFRHAVTGERAHLPDEYLGITPGQRVSNDVRQVVVGKVVEQSYEKSAAAACPQGISRMSVHNIVRELHPVPELQAEGPVRSIPNLYVEADEDHVALQRGKKVQIKLVYIHEGREEKQGKMALKNARYLTWPLEGSTDTLWERVADYVVAQYDVDRIGKVFLSGDGASWIRKGEEWLPKCVPILDAYHVNKALTSLTASIPQGKDRAKALLRAGDKDGFRCFLLEILKVPRSPSQQQKKRELAAYLYRNWQRIQNRKLEDALGCSAEGHVSHVLSARLSSRPLGWGKNNLMTMAELRVMKANKELISYVKNKRPASTPATSHLPPLTSASRKRMRTTITKKLNVTPGILPVLLTGKKSSLCQAIHALIDARFVS